MSKQLAYAVITPYSLSKSRTGGILAQLISRSGLDLVGARMFAPSQKLADEYAALLRKPGHSACEKMRGLLADYVLTHFAPDSATGRKKRVMVLLFSGENAVSKLHEVTGELAAHCASGETIYGTYADLILGSSDSDKPLYFEPALLVAVDAAGAEAAIRLWAKYNADGGVLAGIEQYPEGVKPQLSLTMIKPDNFCFPNGRPGNVLDFFCRTGLNLVGIKVQHMTTAQAMEFYGPVREVLCTKLSGRVANLSKPLLEEVLETPIDEETIQKLGQLLCPVYGGSQFDNIVRFMSGRSEGECKPEELTQPGTVVSIVLIFEGPDAIAKIRNVLGPTDPSKAPPGTIRKEFGTNVMVNAGHASDSEESVKREMGILVDKAPNTFKDVCNSFYK